MPLSKSIDFEEPIKEERDDDDDETLGKILTSESKQKLISSKSQNLNRKQTKWFPNIDKITVNDL